MFLTSWGSLLLYPWFTERLVCTAATTSDIRRIPFPVLTMRTLERALNNTHPCMGTALTFVFPGNNRQWFTHTLPLLLQQTLALPHS